MWPVVDVHSQPIVLSDPMHIMIIAIVVITFLEVLLFHTKIYFSTAKQLEYCAW